MGIERNRPLPIAPRASGLRGLLDSLWPRGASAKPATAEPTRVSDLLDQLQLLNARSTTGGPTSAGAQALALLKQPGQAVRMTPSQWQAAARAYLAAPATQRTALTAQLAAMGVKLEAGEDARYLNVSVAGLRVIVEPATNRLRRSQGDSTLCYEGGALVASIKRSDNQVTVTTRQGTQVWQDGTGQGFADGLPIVPRQAALIPGEPPRRPWATPLLDDLEEPAWNEGTAMSEYAPAYDEAVEQAGGQVLEASDPAATAADLYNCHSFATTGGAGDLFDPFLRESHPHWLNNPIARLTNGPFAQLRDSQQVHPGDVIVYRLEGKVTHTGIVREVDRNGNPTLVESKFGILGRYMHAPFDIPQSYGAPAEYWRPDSPA